MTFDVHFGDGTTVRAEGKTFHCACIIAQAQRVMYDETHEEQLAVIRGTMIKN
jgi:acetoin utilization deacetylase AcuC-like enzyme